MQTALVGWQSCAILVSLLSEAPLKKLAPCSCTCHLSKKTWTKEKKLKKKKKKKTTWTPFRSNHRGDKSERPDESILCHLYQGAPVTSLGLIPAF
jgi:hypothetical protein